MTLVLIALGAFMAFATFCAYALCRISSDADDMIDRLNNTEGDS